MADSDGRIKPNRKKIKARKENTAIFGRSADKTETSGDYALLKNKMLPKSHTDFRRVLAHLNAEIELYEQNPKPGVSNLNLNVFRKMYNIAMREPIENVSVVKCPICKKMHTIECPTCESSHEIEIPSAQFEKNSVAVLLKFSDKLAPNLAAITQDINVNILVTNLSEFCTKLISRYVPRDEKMNVLQELQTTMSKVIEAEYNEVHDGK